MGLIISSVKQFDVSTFRPITTHFEGELAGRRNLRLRLWKEIFVSIINQHKRVLCFNDATVPGIVWASKQVHSQNRGN